LALLRSDGTQTASLVSERKIGAKSIPRERAIVNRTRDLLGALRRDKSRSSCGIPHGCCVLRIIELVVSWCGSPNRLRLSKLTRVGKMPTQPESVFWHAGFTRLM
jgi:hypothetical protein